VHHDRCILNRSSYLYNHQQQQSPPPPRLEFSLCQDNSFLKNIMIFEKLLPISDFSQLRKSSSGSENQETLVFPTPKIILRIRKSRNSRFVRIPPPLVTDHHHHHISGSINNQKRTKVGRSMNSLYRLTWESP
jgi:hypothetical protein